MATFVKCDLCGEEVEQDSSEISGNERWVKVDIEPIAAIRPTFHYDMCPLCRDWLLRTLEATAKAGGRG